MVFHGLDVTHLDSLAHIFWDGKMYGGVAGVDGVGPPGRARCTTCSRCRDGVTTRGVLLDIARLRGVDVLAADDHVYPEDLEAAEQAAGIRVEPGDVRADAHRRGRRPASPRARATTPTSPARASRPRACRGSTSGAWRCSASDVAQDPTPTGYRTVHMPIHMVGIVAMGLWLIDNCQLEDLAGDLRPPRPLGVPVHAGADPLPGRHRQPGQPARRLLIARPPA